MGRRNDDIDWKSVFLSYFSHGASSDSAATRASGVAMAASSDDDERWRGSPGLHQRSEEPRSELERRFGKCCCPDAQQVDGGAQAQHCRVTRAAAKAAVGLGPDVASASNVVYDLSPIDDDKEGEHVHDKNYSKLSPKFSGKKNYGHVPLSKQKSQGHGGKRKSIPVAKMYSRQPSSTTHAIDLKEPDHQSSLPSKFSKRRKQQLEKSSSIYSRKCNPVACNTLFSGHENKRDRIVQHVVLLNDEDMEHKEEVNREISDRLNEPKIYYPSRDDQEAVELTRSDIKCLDPEVFLSSHVINFYIKNKSDELIITSIENCCSLVEAGYIKMTRLCDENFRDKFYIFNTYFYGKLEEALRRPRDFPKLRRWWKGVNIFNNAYIILPIHGKYLEKEWRFLSVAWPCLLNDIRKEVVQVPQQNNAYDCGVFMLYYIEQFIKKAPARFTTDKLGMFNRSWFKPEEASGLRQRIRELLLEEFGSARPDEAASEADVAAKRKEGISAAEWNQEEAGRVVSESDSCSYGAGDEKGTVKADSGSAEAEKEVCEITGTKVWIKRVYRRTGWPPGNWCWSSGGSSRDARRAFIEQFSRK
ncbi:Ubiquitin-like-specific protease 1D [Zea mays]|uniref:Ubiquitin-like-specific protease 1D n=1 Tax=Zea mays TaxID=4577 RepID=A0A317Y9L2_MAIZE|nr:Ubiquitin-like-specific protease 1D [Zea mays]